MLHEYADLIDIRDLPAKLNDLKWHIAGFIDGDGSLPIMLSPVPDKRFGWLIQPRFQIELRNDQDSNTMLRIVKRTFSINTDILKGDTYVKLVVTNRRLLLEKIVPFCRKYKLALKQDDFDLMRNILEALQDKKHLEENGFKAIIRQIYSSPSDSEGRRRWSFNDIIPNEQPPDIHTASNPVFPEGSDLRNYTAGFIDAEGSLGYAILPDTKTITPYMTVTHQNITVLRKIQQTIRSGQISSGRLQTYGVANIVEKIVPFLEKHRLIAKQSVYARFKDVLENILQRKHKTRFGEVERMARSVNHRGILRDHTLSTDPIQLGK